MKNGVILSTLESVHFTFLIVKGYGVIFSGNFLLKNKKVCHHQHNWTISWTSSIQDFRLLQWFLENCISIFL